MSSFFEGILTFILDIDISQNKYFQCVENILYIIMRKVFFELMNCLFDFAIIKFNTMAIFEMETVKS